jgi:hypothetical protein
MSSFFGGMLRRLGVGSDRKEQPRLFERTFAAVDHPLRSTLDARYSAMREAMASGQREAIAAL